MRRDRPLIWGLALGIAGLGGEALGHEFQLVELSPSEGWCAELHASAHPGDVVRLAPGTYPGGCVLRLGGLPEENEALVVQGEPGVVLRGDEAGLALRVEGVTTRLVGLAFDGRLEVVADHVTVDASRIDCLNVAPEVTVFTLLFSEVPRLDLALFGGVVRGNRLGSAEVHILDGVVSDNAVFGDLVVGASAQRNVVLGDLVSEVEAFGNVVHGDVSGAGALYGNTLLAAVDGPFDARNNLTVAAELGEGNLRCADCLVDGFDPRPRGAALEVPPVEAPGDTLDFCRTPRQTVGAVNPSDRAAWTVFDRDPLGCVESLGDIPEPPAGTCPAPPSVAPLEVRDRGRGCATGPTLPVGFLPWILPLLWRRRCSS